jgi:hypothetical protein
MTWVADITTAAGDGPTSHMLVAQIVDVRSVAPKKHMFRLDFVPAIELLTAPVPTKRPSSPSDGPMGDSAADSCKMHRVE